MCLTELGIRHVVHTMPSKEKLVDRLVESAVVGVLLGESRN